MNGLLRLILRSQIRGITLPPFGIYIRAEFAHDVGVLAHEQVHWAQYERMGAAWFYLAYIGYWLWYGSKEHPMEVEARNISGVA